MAPTEQAVWRAAHLPRFDGHAFPKEVDVAVVGGGITGLTAALLLKQSGRTVAVFERERIGAGETGNTSGHLTYVTDQSLQTLVKRFGRDAARLVWEGGARAIDLIETVATGQDETTCEFRRVPGFYCSPFVRRDTDGDAVLQLREEGELASDLGFAAQYLERGPVTGKPAIGYADQALFHPLRYCGFLAQAVHGNGSYVREMAEVGDIIQDPLAVIVDGETVACGHVIIATHVPLAGSTPLLSALLFQAKLYPYSTYVVRAHVGKEAPPPGLYSDVSDPYWYLRIDEERGERHAIFGGADHKTGQTRATEPCFKAVEHALAAIIPSARIERRWSGQVIETNDGLPYIGATGDHQFVATGYAGNGLTFGTLAGMILHDGVMGLSNPWRAMFDPNRKTLSARALTKLVGENIDYPYYFVADRLRRDPKPRVQDIKPGEGKVLTIDDRRVACHRTRAGRLVKVSAVCTHLGCLVRWNDADMTWDCPCHGSRFTPEGLVIGGPAEAPLERIED